MGKEKLVVEGKEIILVGTAHISEKSIALAEKAIREENPDCVGVELDLQRLKQLKQGEQWSEMNLEKVIATGQTYLLLFNLLLANIQRQFGQKLGVKPGQEMIRAIEVAEEQGKQIVLLDRDVRVTLKRALDKMSFIERLKLLYSLSLGLFGYGREEITKEKIEEIKQQDMINKLMLELSKEMPSIKEVLVDERDAFIAHQILSSPGKKIVAIIGAGHVDGIKKNLMERKPVAGLTSTVKRKSLLSYAKYLVPVIFIALLAYAFLSKGIETGMGVFIAWFLITGLLSALGVLIARGHVYSALTAFLAAPFAALHPLLAVGWFAGAVEAKFNSPKIKDFENLRNLNSLGDFTKNKVTRILLVAAFANLGSTIGTIIALPYIVATIS